jgi:hypothetical protein
MTTADGRTGAGWSEWSKPEDRQAREMAEG